MGFPVGCNPPHILSLHHPFITSLSLSVILSVKAVEVPKCDHSEMVIRSTPCKSGKDPHSSFLSCFVHTHQTLSLGGAEVGSHTPARQISMFCLVVNPESHLDARRFNVPTMWSCPHHFRMTWTDDIVQHTFQSEKLPRLELASPLKSSPPLLKPCQVRFVSRLYQMSAVFCA